MTAELSYEFAFGTYEDALRMVGTRTEPRFAGTAVSGARIQHFASMVRDPNPSYWDADFAKSAWGGLVAPPALLIGLLMPPPWVPNGQPPTASIAVRVPLPGTAIINVAVTGKPGGWTPKLKDMYGKPPYRPDSDVPAVKSTGVPKIGRAVPKKPSPDTDGGLEPQPEG